MARYAKVADLAAVAGVGWRALARAAAPDDSAVGGPELEAEVEAPAGGSTPVAAAAARLERALADASAIADSYVRSRYPEFPARAATDPPNAVSAAVVDLALARVFPGDERWSDAAGRARKWLEMVASGAISLDEDGDGDPDAEPAPLTAAATPTLTRESMSGFLGEIGG